MLKHAIKNKVIIFPNYESNETSKGLEMKLLKEASIIKTSK